MESSSTIKSLRPGTVSGVSLNRGLERLWRLSLDCCGDSEMLEMPAPWDTCLPRRATDREWNQSKREERVAVNEAERSWGIWRVLWYQTRSCEVWSLPFWFSALFWSNISSLCSPSSLWNINEYSVSLHVGSMLNETCAFVAISRYIYACVTNECFRTVFREQKRWLSC